MHVEESPLADSSSRSCHLSVGGLQRAAEEDSFGHRVHLALAVAWGFSFPMVMVPGAKDVFLAALVAWSIARVVFGGVRYAWRPIFSMPITWFITGWALWTCLSLAWSPESGWGLEELRAFRSFLIPISLFPVILHYNRILSAFLIAIAIINLIQIAQSLGIAWIDPVRPNRYCAWIAPNPGGLLLAAAFVAHIAWFILDCRRGRAVLHIGGGVLAAIGLLLMVNRGAIVAVGVGAIVILAAGIILLPRARVAVLLAAIAMTIGMAMGLLLDNVAFDGRITAPMRRQAQSGFDDLANSDKFVGRPIYRRSVMYRVEVWKAALEAIGQRPIVGIGVGGVWHAFDAHPEFTANDRTAVDYIPVDGDHRHVHNTWLFIAVTTGLIGSLLMVLTIGSGLVAEARRAAASHPIAFVGFGIVVTWMVGNVFDTLIISGSTSCLLILGLLPAWIPRSQD